MPHQIKNINKEIEIINKESNRNSGVESTITEIKNLLKGLNRYVQTKERISKPEGRSIEIIQSKENKE